jgi:hypothetical protein
MITKRVERSGLNSVLFGSSRESEIRSAVLSEHDRRTAALDRLIAGVSKAKSLDEAKALFEAELPNAHAQAARARKVAALVAYFDAALVRLGKCPRRDAAEIARTLRDQFDQLSWFAHARAARQRRPSLTTQAQVIAVYEQRVAAS